MGQAIKGMNKKSCSVFADSQCIALIAVVLLVSLIGLFTGKFQVSGINSRTKYGSIVPILGDNKMQERRQAETVGQMEDQLELGLLFWEWLRTGLVVLEAV